MKSINETLVFQPLNRTINIKPRFDIVFSYQQHSIFFGVAQAASLGLHVFMGLAPLSFRTETRTCVGRLDIGGGSPPVMGVPRAAQTSGFQLCHTRSVFTGQQTRVTSESLPAPTDLTVFVSLTIVPWRPVVICSERIAPALLHPSPPHEPLGSGTQARITLSNAQT